MNIFAKSGHKVKCTTFNAGYDHDKEIAQKYLEVGKEYTIDHTVVHNWSTEVYLLEFPEVRFNSVFFEDVEDLVAGAMTLTEPVLEEVWRNEDNKWESLQLREPWQQELMHKVQLLVMWGINLYDSCRAEFKVEDYKEEMKEITNPSFHVVYLVTKRRIKEDRFTDEDTYFASLYEEIKQAIGNME